MQIDKLKSNGELIATRYEDKYKIETYVLGRKLFDMYINVVSGKVSQICDISKYSADVLSEKVLKNLKLELWKQNLSPDLKTAKY